MQILKCDIFNKITYEMVEKLWLIGTIILATGCMIGVGIAVTSIN